MFKLDNYCLACHKEDMLNIIRINLNLNKVEITYKCKKCGTIYMVNFLMVK